MTKTKRLDGKKKLLSLSAKMENDMRLYCRKMGIKNESELVREAITAYIYAGLDGEAAKPKAAADDLCRRMEALQNTLDRIFKTG